MSLRDVLDLVDGVKGNDRYDMKLAAFSLIGSSKLILPSAKNAVLLYIQLYINI